MSFSESKFVNRTPGEVIEILERRFDELPRLDELIVEVNEISNIDPEGEPFLIDPGIEVNSLIGRIDNYQRRHGLSDYTDFFALRRVIGRLKFEKLGRVLSSGSTSEAWQLHLKTNRGHILNAMKIADKGLDHKKKKTAVVLGAGSCMDIPLKELVLDGYHVILVDLDRPSMEAAVRKLSKDLADEIPSKEDRANFIDEHVSLEVRDLTDGALNKITYKVELSLRKSGGSARESAAAFSDEFSEFARKYEPPVPDLTGDHKVDLLISSMLITVIGEFPHKYIADTFHDKYRRQDDAKIEEAAGLVTRKIQSAHASALEDFVREDGGVAFCSADVVSRDYIYMQAMGRMPHPSAKGSEYNLSGENGKVEHLKEVFSESDLNIQPTPDWIWRICSRDECPGQDFGMAVSTVHTVNAVIVTPN